MWILLLLCFIHIARACRSSQIIEETDGQHKNKSFKYFSTSAWGGWIPTNSSWKEWIEVWGNENSSAALDSTESGRDPDSGWPSYWKGMGKGNAGVPPPPWAFLPENYGRPQFCYLQPEAGNCKGIQNRWGFNPTVNGCEKFMYTGCGANENNFLSRQDCDRACGRTPDTDCEGGRGE